MSKFFGNAADSRADVREDEEAKLKFDAILDLLLAGGYFRARIQGLSPFDKVIGGMAWAITSSAGDLDIDIFFQENAQIGQKIILSEQILDGLARLGCTLPLQSFQIQGLDFPSIFPVIQWLIKKVMEVRAETGDLVRAYSEAQFSKAHMMPQDAAFAANKPSAIAFAEQVDNSYRPRRTFVRRADNRQVSEEEEVALVLMEYGSRGIVGAADAGAKKSKGDDEDEAKAAEAEEAAYQQRMKRLAALDGGDLSQAAMAGFLPSEEMQRLLNDYEAGVSEDGPIAGLHGKKLAEKQHATKVASLERQIAEIKVQGKALEQKHAKVSEEHGSLTSQVAERRAFRKRLTDAIAELEAKETPENAPLLKQLKELVALHEALAQHEATFRRQCAAELARLKARIVELEAEQAESQTEGADAEREQILREAEEKDAKKRARLENALAERRCAMAIAERKLDTVPSRAELQQYQRQFVELYEQIAAREVETRRYFNTYNTLEDTRNFLNKETTIYESILENYKLAMKKKSARNEFVAQVAAIVTSVNESLAKVDSKLESEVAAKNDMVARYQALVDKERTYFKLAKQFQEACALNESSKTN